MELAASSDFPSDLRVIAVSVGITLAVVAAREAVNPVLGEASPLLLVLAAPILAALYGGWASGLLATVLGGALAQVLFVQSGRLGVPADASQWLQLGMYLVEGALFSWLLHQRRHAAMALELERAALLKAHGELESREQRVVQVLEAAPSGMLVVDEEGRITLANAQAEQLFGLRREQLVGSEVDDLLPDAVREIHRAHREAYMKAPTRRAMGVGRDLYARRSDGSVFPVEIGLNPIADPGRRLVLASVLDISQRKAAEGQTKAREEEFRLLFEWTPVPKYVIDFDSGRFLMCNSAALEHFGFSQDEMHRMSVSDIDVQQDSDRIRRNFEDLRHHPLQIETRHRTQRGEILDVIVRAVGIELRGRPVVLATCLDITEQKLAQSREREARERLALALEAGGMGLWQWKMSAERSTWNQRQFELLGLEPTADGRVDTQAFFRGVDPRDVPGLQSAIRRSVEHGTDFHAEFKVLHPVLGERWIAGRGRLVRAATGDAKGEPMMIGLNWDITDRMQREEALSRANQRLESLAAELEERVADRTRKVDEANKELEGFAYTVAHDLRAPLRNVQGFANALLEDEAEHLSEDGRDFAERIVAGSVRMDQLIVDLLEYSRLARSDVSLEPVELGAALDEARHDVSQALEAAGARIDVPADLPSVLGHRATLVRVLANLLSNAAKFVAEGTRPVIEVLASREGSQVVLTVRDNGIGIEPRHQARIFGVFERLHGQEAYPGTGIGLAIVRKGVERMSGSVSVHSEPGGGSRFMVRLRSPDR